MKKLLSIALLVSAFAVVPAFAMDGGEPQEPKKSWCPFARFVELPVFNEIYGLKHPTHIPGHYYHFLKDLALFAPIKTGVTFLIANYIYNNVNFDAIKAQLGLGQADNSDEGQVFADASRCDCENEEEQKEEAACELKKKRS